MKVQSSKFKVQSCKSKFKIHFLFFICIFYLFSFLFSLAPPSAEAAQQRNDTAIFTGQVIPAYIGGAYDPTEGFKKLAGLPIYVFAYDSWQGNNFVIHNFAVRTQIRADGSFQAQGLPTAAHYGVYFPFFGDPGGNVTRRDGLPDAPQTAEFRWPVENDKIRDVFSYVVGNAGEAIQIVDQFGNPITLGQAFLTNERKLDIDNTINVFPLIPHRALRITVQLTESEQDATYEVYAQRVTRETAGVDAPKIVAANYPIIRGRTNPATKVNDMVLGVFQAYAPEGFYVITTWRSETGSTTYKDYSGQDALNSGSTGLAFLNVHRDWQELLSAVWTNQMTQAPNRIIVWGLVTDERSVVQTSDNSNFGAQDLAIDIKTDTDIAYSRKYQVDPDGDFWQGPGFGSFENPPDTTWKGLYALYQNISTLGAQLSPLNEHNWVYIDGYYDAGGVFHDGGYKENPTPPRGIIQGTDGPVRIDLTASASSNPDTYPLGYDTGLHIDILDAKNGGFFDPPLSYATVRIIPIKEKKGFYIPAAFKPYAADRLGRIHIADNDLVCNQSYFIEVRAGNYLGYTQVDDYLCDADGHGYKQINIRLKNMALATTKSNYKIFGLIPVPWLQVQAAGEKGIIKGTLALSRGAQLLGPSWYIDKVTGSGTGREPCLKPRCEVIPDDLTQAMAAGGGFEVHLPKAPTAAEVIAECSLYPPIDPLSGMPMVETCSSLQSTSVITDTYILHIEGTIQDPDRTRVLSIEQTLTIDSNGLTSPPFLMTLEIDCNKTFPVGLTAGFATSLANVPNRSACQFGQFFISKSTALFGAFQKHALQTRPLIKEQAVVSIWNIIRNLTNVFFIIFLLFVGITTILRYEPKTWSPGSLIPKLLLAIVLANFSLLIVQLFIDVSNVLTQTIFNLTQGVLTNVVPEDGGRILLAGTQSGVAGAALVGSLAIWISHMGVGLLGAVASAAATGGLSLVPILITGTGIFLSILLFILGLILLYFIRYFAIWICTILAPLIFAISIFPSKTISGFSEIWWNTLLPFIVMQPVTAFVLSVGLMLLTVGGGEGSLFGGFGIAIMGLITLFFSIKIPSIVGSMFKGGLIEGKGLGMAPEGLMKRRETFMKDTMTKENVAGAMTKAQAQGKGIFRSVLAGVSGAGKFQQEQENIKAAEDATKAATGRPAKVVMEEEATLIRRWKVVNEMMKGMGGGSVSMAKMRDYDTFLQGASPSTRVSLHTDTGVQRKTLGSYGDIKGSGKNQIKARNAIIAEMHTLGGGEIGDVRGTETRGDTDHTRRVGEQREGWRENFQTVSGFVHAHKT